MVRAERDSGCGDPGPVAVGPLGEPIGRISVPRVGLKMIFATHRSVVDNRPARVVPGQGNPFRLAL
jgi:hypothetical protein